MASRQVPIRHILAPLDFSSSSLDAVEYAIHLAKGLDATVTLMHVLEPVCYDLDCGLGMIEGEAGKRDHWTRELTELTQLAAWIRTAGGFRDFWGDSLRCDPGLRLAASIRSHCDGDTWASRSNRRTLWKRGGGSAAPDDLPDLDRKDAEVRRGSPSCDAAGDGREAVRIVTSRLNEFDFAHIVVPVSIPDDVRDHEVLCPLEATGCDDVLD